MGRFKMTYKQFIEDMRDQANNLENLVKESQVINMGDEMAEDDTLLEVYTDGVEELMDNITGVHGHTLEWRA
jgi:hypothetical protein